MNCNNKAANTIAMPYIADGVRAFCDSVKCNINVFGGHILALNETAAAAAAAASKIVVVCWHRIRASVLLALEAATEINSGTMRFSFIHPMVLFHFLI